MAQFSKPGKLFFYETLKYYRFNGKLVSYSVQLKEPERNKNAVNWYRANPHRLQLGNIGFEITKKDGNQASIDDFKNMRQTLNMWTGEIHSHFTVENVPVDVITYCHQQDDMIALRVNSALINQKKIAVRFRLPYPTGDWGDMGIDWASASKHQSSLTHTSSQSALLTHTLDTTKYAVDIQWKGAAQISQKEDHYYLLVPSGDSSFEFSTKFSADTVVNKLSTFAETKNNNEQQWKKFWEKGGAVDFSGSIDPRAKELERRIVLSQYLTKIQCAGDYPPQETGLTYNSWYGKPHLEMHWWHAIHFALWGRIDLLEKEMLWYAKAYNRSESIGDCVRVMMAFGGKR